MKTTATDSQEDAKRGPEGFHQYQVRMEGGEKRSGKVSQCLTLKLPLERMWKQRTERGLEGRECRQQEEHVKGTGS